MQLKNEIEHLFKVRPEALTQPEVEEMIDALPRLVVTDAKKLLGRLLLHFAKDPAPLTYSSPGDRLIFFLDGNSRGVTDPISKKLTKEALEAFSFAEAQVVRKWLEEVGVVRFSQLCKEDVFSALGYWEKRVKLLSK